MSMAEATKKYAVVTGANKGIGFAICRQLASKGIRVVLTARDEKKGIEAVEKLKNSGYEDVVFHQLDVAESASISRLADFIASQFGKLDILVNNAGVGGAVLRPNVDVATLSDIFKAGPSVKWKELSTQSYELAEECVRINYHGATRMCEALIPLLQLSDSPRIVNVSSTMGKLQFVTNKWAMGVLGDVEKLTEKRVDEVLREYLKDYEEGMLETKGWPDFMSAYILSKAAMNASTRVLAKKHPTILINCVCPGYVKTDINNNTGILTAEEGAESCVRLALLSNGGPSGLFFFREEETSFELTN